MEKNFNKQNIDDFSLTLLTQKLNNKSNNKGEKVKTDVNDNLPKEEVAADKDTIFLKSEINFLRSEINEKNLQIINLNNRLETEQDIKLIGVMEHMEIKKENYKKRIRMDFFIY